MRRTLLGEGAKADASDNTDAADKDRVAARLKPIAAVEETTPATALARKEKTVRPARTVLSPAQSAALREKLLADIGQLRSADEAADWVHKNLVAKNTLIDADADAIEASFRERLATIELASAASQEEPQSPPSKESGPLVEKPFVVPMDDAVMVTPAVIPSETERARRRRVVAKTIRLRDKEHCKFVTTQPCIVCGRTPSEAHHIRFAQPRALGRKVSDEYTVPVCRLHHRDLHAHGDEASWWAGVSVDPLPIALELWRRSRVSELPVSARPG